MKYEIWQEAWILNFGGEPAKLLATIDADVRSFDEAVMMYSDRTNQEVEYNAGQWSRSGVKLYDNKEDAENPPE